MAYQIQSIQVVAGGFAKVSIVGKSTDDKPLKAEKFWMPHAPVRDIATGSVFYEKDTGNALMFDADTKTWDEIPD